MRHLPLITIYGYVGGSSVMRVRVYVANYMVMWALDRFKRLGVRVGVANFFLYQSIGINEKNTRSMIGIEENNTFKLKICGR